MFYKIVSHGPYRIRQTTAMAVTTPTVLKASTVGAKWVLPARKKKAVRRKKPQTKAAAGI